jgi:NADH:ubiquinone oxidoreductase subunit 6 (subunit J)
MALVFMTVLSAFMVVTERNIVHAAVYLGLSFIGVAGIYFLLNTPFLAAAQILIYVGAITVLILFALMMTQQRIMREPRNPGPGRILAGVVSLAQFAALVWCAWQGPWYPETVSGSQGADSLDLLAGALLGPYLLPFEVASVLLLGALVGAIVLAKEERS